MTKIGCIAFSIGLFITFLSSIHRSENCKYAKENFEKALQRSRIADRTVRLRELAKHGDLDAIAKLDKYDRYVRARDAATCERPTNLDQPELLRDAAANGDPNAMLKLGKELVDANASQQSLVDGAALIRRAAMANDACSPSARDAFRALPRDLKLEACFGNAKFLKKFEAGKL